MTEKSGKDYCNYIFPDDFDAERDPDPHQQNNCIRNSLPDADRCALHAEPDETEHKTEQLEQKDSVGDSLDGAILPEEYADSVDLTGIHLLRDADLSSADLEYTDLSGTILRYADLSEADLDFADLSGADLYKTDLSGADLRGTDLSDAKLKLADLSEARLNYADLSKARLNGADLSRTDLSPTERVGYHSGFEAANADRTDLKEADLIEANLREADLESVNFNHGDLTGATLVGADCEDATFIGTNLNRATLETADLSGATLSLAYLYQTRLDGCQINEETQFSQDGDVGDMGTNNACRYDSKVSPDSAAESISTEAMNVMDASAEEIRARRARSTYTRLENLAGENGFPDLKSEMFIRRQDARRELLQAQGQSLKAAFTSVQKFIFNYGESFSRIGVISLATILISWVLYMTTGIIETDDGSPVGPGVNDIVEDPALIHETLLHSVLVFFSGSRVLETTGLLGESIVVIEAMIGPILVALLIFVLGRRAAR